MTKINRRELVEMYNRGEKLFDIAEYFDVTPPAIHYALTQAGVKRNRIHTPNNLSWNRKPVRQRLLRHKQRLAEAIDANDAPTIRKYIDLIARENAILEHIREAGN